MKYFTAKEASTIISKTASAELCANDPSNPNAEAMQALYDAVLELDNQPMIAAILGFALGRAVGTREERARRKGHICTTIY